MSVTTDIPQLDLREQIVRIDRAIAETQKFQAEAGKFNRDRWLAPVVAIASVTAAVGGIIAAYGTLFRAVAHP